MIIGPQLSPVVPSRFAHSADQLEAAFLGEMLKAAMPDVSAASFGGGAGESQFASFLHEQYAATLAGKLDLGLASVMEARNA